MKRIIFLVTIFSFSMITYAQKQFVVDENAEQRSINGSFSTVMVSDGIDLYLSQSDDEAVAISASEEKYKDRIKAVVENNILKIYYDGEKRWNGRDKQMKAYVSFKELEKIDASGASDIIVAGEIKVSSLLMKLSGASNFKGTVMVSTLKLILSGASDININGIATIVNIESSGASDVKGYELTTDICTAKLSGASDVNIIVNKELSAHASGSSRIIFEGTAVIKDFVSSGSSTIKRRD